MRMKIKPSISENNSPNSENKSSNSASDSLSSESESEEVCEVERIMGKQIVYGEIKYLIKWKDYSLNHNSWEPIENLDCPTNIAEYEAKHVDSDDTLKWVPKPMKILSSQMIDDKMEYFVRFVDGTETMVAHTFGPMKPLIKAYEKQQAKQTRTSTKMRADGKKSARKVVKREVKSPDQNENREENITDTVDLDTNNDVDAATAGATDAAMNTKNCMHDHGIDRIHNMRRDGDKIQFEVECSVCDRYHWQPINIVKRRYPQKVIEFYESCIEWKRQ